MMKLEEFVKLLENSDRIRILKDGKEIFMGWLAILTMHNESYENMRTETVKRFRAVPEIRHKRWEELNLDKPLMASETPDYKFSDLRMDLYYTIYI